MLGILVAALVLAAGPTGAAAEVGDVGFRGASWDAAGVNGPTAEKPQSKLWFHDGTWWGVLFNPGSDDWEIHELDLASQTWTPTGTPIDSRNASWADALWNGTTLYVASAGRDPSAGSDAARLFRFSYAAASKSYTLDAGFPVDIVKGGMEAIVIDEDSQGVLWATWTRNSKVYVTRSTNGGAKWDAAFVPPVDGTTVSDDDISAVVAFGGRIGVMWSNQADDALYFATHRDGDGAKKWEASRTALQGPNQADDHISIRSVQGDASGLVLAVVKTSLNDVPNPDPSLPLTMLLARNPDGSWSSHVVGRVSDDHTRPIAILDSEHRSVYVIATAPTGGGTIASGTATTGIFVKRASLPDLDFEAGPGTPLMTSTTDTAINNATSTKQGVTSASGLVVLASDNRTKRYLHNVIPLAGASMRPERRPRGPGLVPS